MYCPHCSPYEHRRYLSSDKALEYCGFILDIIGINKVVRATPGLGKAVQRHVPLNILRILLLLGVIREIDITGNEDWLPGYQSVVVREAKRRGVPLRQLAVRGERPTQFFSVKVGGKKEFFENLPHLTLDHVQDPDVDNKVTFKKMLRENGFPCVEGKVFSSGKKALEYGIGSGFPLVVKPSDNNLSKHVTCNIRNEDALQEAIRVVKKLSREFLVERFVEGQVYRITIINGEVIACCRREAAHIVGDGTRTIRELIEMKNADPRRCEQERKNGTLRKIPINEKTSDMLAGIGMGLQDVATAGEKVYLHDKVILACGADIHDSTEEIHPENKELFHRLAALCNSPLVGFDLICEDIAVSWRNQQCAILEANTCPAINMHHFPVTGKARNVAGRLLDHCGIW